MSDAGVNESSLGWTPVELDPRWLEVEPWTIESHLLDQCWEPKQKKKKKVYKLSGGYWNWSLPCLRRVGMYKNKQDL